MKISDGDHEKRTLKYNYIILYIYYILLNLNNPPPPWRVIKPTHGSVIRYQIEIQQE